MTGLRDESINTQRMILTYDLIKISVGREGGAEFFLLIKPKLKG